MSEYQYYEFQAIDRPLSGKEMNRLRAYSTRARITTTSFVNEYEWGNFRGDADRWMERYFDAFTEHRGTRGAIPARVNLRSLRVELNGIEPSAS